MSFSLIAKFGMDATGVRAELKQLRKETDDFLEKWANRVLIAAGTALSLLAKGALSMAEELHKSSLELGINVEKLQVLDALALRNNESQETLRKALEKTRLSVQEAAEGNKKAADALAKLGINAAEIIRLPLEQQFTRIARGVKTASDQSAAYNAVADLFGAKIGPQLMNSLNELGGPNGFEKAAKSAKDAGHIMSAETIVALERAQSAIDEFKRKATIAVGNILVNFQSVEGLKLLGLQLMKVAGQFGGMIIDGFVEAGQIAYAILKGTFIGATKFLHDGFIESVKMFATALNKVLPDKFDINIANLDQFKSDGKYVADSIAEAIAKTSPSTFKKDFGDFWQKGIDEQKKVVDAMTRVDLTPEADKLRKAGDHIKNSMVDGAKPMAEAAKAMKEVTESMRETALRLKMAVGDVKYIGGNPEELSDTQLEALANKTSFDLSKVKQADGSTSSTFGGFKSIEQYVLQQQLDRLRAEQDARANYRNTVSRSGIGVAEATLPADQFNRFQSLYGDSVTKQTTSLASIDQQLKDLLNPR